MAEKYTHLTLEARVERIRAHLTQRETELFDNELNITANEALVDRLQPPKKGETQAAVKKMEAMSFNLRIGLQVMRAELALLEDELAKEAAAAEQDEAEAGIERIPTSNGRHKSREPVEV